MSEWISWLPPIVTGVHVVWFTFMTYWGYRQRRQFLIDLRRDREEGLDEATARVVALFDMSASDPIESREGK